MSNTFLLSVSHHGSRRSRTGRWRVGFVMEKQRLGLLLLRAIRFAVVNIHRNIASVIEGGSYMTATQLAVVQHMNFKYPLSFMQIRMVMDTDGTLRSQKYPWKS